MFLVSSTLVNLFKVHCSHTTFMHIVLLSKSVHFDLRESDDEQSDDSDDNVQSSVDKDIVPTAQERIART
ncbi:hypothetical protein V6N13_134686 [Hibiscus sabdariffa]